ncbi:CBS domain-containing protein [Streptomyces triculaminicus]|uniref:CBS domain-containing protein n=1 Tax=Streptomyces triculaminicus TaxID=2816232 RepID=UPI0033C5AAC2
MSRSAGGLTESTALITADMAITDALELLASTGTGSLPVLDPTGTQLVGWLTHHQVLCALQPTPWTAPHAAP